MSETPFLRSSNTLERRKLDYCRYEYFILDSEANRIKEIDNKYYNCKQIGEFEHFYIEEEWLSEEDDRCVKREYSSGFRYFEFSYDYRTPPYTRAKRLMNDTYGDYTEDIPEDEDYDENDLDVQVIEGDNMDIVLKAIFNDNGELIIDGIKEVRQFIPQIEAIIIQLHVDKNGIWEKEYLESFGDDSKLLAVTNLKGEILFKPARSEIKFIEAPTSSEIRGVFEVGGILLYDSTGQKIGFRE